ncbi:MAG: hypothetical protein JNL58_30265 [Planctomyces sp.]|nr:hypothetical protein [Planctomyces sp.]
MWLHEYITEETPNFLRVHDSRHDFNFEMYGEAPVQAFGEIGGREFYFRARHGEWHCEVSDANGQFPSDGGAGCDGFIRDGKYTNASYMPLREALKIIDRCMTEYFDTSTDSSALNNHSISDDNS